MKTYQIVLIIVILLVINNIALLSFIGHFSEQETAVTAQEGSTPDTAAEVEVSSTIAASSNSIETPIENSNPALPQTTEVTLAVEKYIRSEQFAVVMDDWQLSASQRFGEASARMKKMNGQELHAVMLDAENLIEKMTALDILLQGGKLKQLSNTQLKSLYTEIEHNHWGKAKLLNVLLENDDPEALVWAKTSITQNAFSNSSSGDIYNAVYEKDPEFITRHLEQFELDPSSSQYSLLTFVSQEPELARLFYARNFDKILNSDNDELFMFGAPSKDIEMTRQQESKTLELLGSNNRYKRNFAIGLTANIKDAQTLREAYSNLNRSKDKVMFIGNLLTPTASAEASALGREIISSSDDPNIQRLSRGSY